MQQRSMKWRIEVTWVFIREEDEKQETNPDAATA